MNMIVEKLKPGDYFCFLSESPNSESKYVILEVTENMELYGYLLDKKPETIVDNSIKEKNIYMLHREDGPAFIWKKEIYLPHCLYVLINEDAIIPMKKDDKKTNYYIKGKNYSEKCFWEI